MDDLRALPIPRYPVVSCRNHGDDTLQAAVFRPCCASCWKTDKTIPQVSVLLTRDVSTVGELMDALLSTSTVRISACIHLPDW